MSLPKVTACYITRLVDEFDERVFAASVAAVRAAGFCVKIVDTSPDPQKVPTLVKGAVGIDRLVTLIQPSRDRARSFAELRSLTLEGIELGEWMYWIDADEVPFPEQLRDLFRHVLCDHRNGAVRTRFIHFCLHPRWYERYEPRTTFLRVSPELHWVGAVHERLEPLPKPHRVFHSDMVVHHYGYCKDPALVFKKWQHYADLENDHDRYSAEEVDGKTVPYFRPGQRTGPGNILDDRAKTLMQYFGLYPNYELRAWLESQCSYGLNLIRTSR